MYLFFQTVIRDRAFCIFVFLEDIIKPNCLKSYGYAISKLLPTGAFKWIDPKDFDFSSNGSKDCVLKVYSGYLKELRGLHNDYPLVPDKIEIKKEIFSMYQLNIADFYHIPIGIVKKLVPNFFDRVNDMKSKCKLI